MDWKFLLMLAAGLALFFLLKRSSLVSEADARRYLSEGAVVIDVRTDSEFQEGHVPGALHHPLGGITESIPRRFPERDRVLLVHCLSGGRSGIAKMQLRRLGYTRVFNLGSLERARRIVGSK